MLLYLPKELLFHIALNINSNTCLINLALTHRSFLDIVRERLLRNASIPLRSIPHFIVLASRYPRWAHTITHIELRDDSSSVKIVPYNVTAVAVCRTLISNTWQGTDCAKIHFALQLYHASPALWTAMLFAALPHAKSLSLRPRSDALPVAYAFILRLYARPGPDNELLELLEAYVLQRLETLTVRAPPDMYDPIAVAHLPNLKMLVADGPCLRPKALRGYGSRQQWLLEHTHPEGSLPAGLQTLHVLGDVESMPWSWLRELQWHQTPGLLGKRMLADLKIRLCFPTVCRTVAKIIYQEPNHGTIGDIFVGRLLWEYGKIDADFQTLFRPEGAQHAGGEQFEQKPLFETIEIVRREIMSVSAWYDAGAERVCGEG